MVLNKSFINCRMLFLKNQTLTIFDRHLSMLHLIIENREVEEGEGVVKIMFKKETRNNI